MTINFNVNPYYDDYTEDDKFLRVLFRPGYAVQARELTQAQTILQKQVSRLGDHIFKNGSMVIPGNINVDNQVHFAKLGDLYEGVSVKSYLTQFKDKVITGSISGLKAVVIDTSECACVLADEKEIATLYYKIDGTGDDDETKRFIPGEQLTALQEDNQTTTNYRLTVNQTGNLVVSTRSFGDTGLVGTSYTNNPVTDVLGYAFLVDVKEGIYYIDGFFVKNDELHLYVGRFNTTPSARVGFRVNEVIVTPEDDGSLNDNAQGSNNFAAPGAHRYKLQLELVKKAIVSTDEDRFVELLRVKDGAIQQKISKSSYAELEKTFARRTFDESGSYEVNKFKLSTYEHLLDGDNLGIFTPEENGSVDKFVAAIDSGKAYVQGYEIESVTTQYISMNKARDEATGHVSRLNAQPISTQIGNYVLVKNVYSFPNINTFQTVHLVNKLNATPGAAPSAGDIVGTARVRSFQLHNNDFSSPIFKLSLFEIQMNSGRSFDVDVKQIVGGLSGSTNFTCDINPTLKEITGSGSTTTSSTTLSGIGTKFTDDVVAGDVIFVDGVFVGTVSVVTNNTTLTLTANGAAAKSNGTLSVFRSRIFQPEFTPLLFNVGYDSVKTLLGWDGTSYSQRETVSFVRRQFESRTASSSQISQTLTNETFGSDLEDYVLIKTSDGTNPVNAIVNLDISNISISNESKTVTFTGLTTGHSYAFIATVRQSNAVGGARDKVIATVSDSITTRKSVTSKSIPLTKADVLRIKSIKMNSGDFSTTSTTGLDITDRFILDNGQRDTHYTNGSIILKPGATVPSGALLIEYQYFNHGTNGQYFSVDSYAPSIADETADFSYEDIPSHSVRTTDGSSREIFLHDVIDYRPVLGGTNASSNEIPFIGNEMTADIAHYLPRIDKLILDSISSFGVIQGVPATAPQEPLDPQDGMVIATIIVPAYTKSVKDIKIIQRDNRRYTMRDIGNLERRIANLEYYVSLSVIEVDTAQLQIKDAITGLDRFKNGFIVDQFTGHGIGDVINPDYKASIDPINRELRPMHYTDAVEIVEDLESPAARTTAGYQKTGDFITLPYEEELFIFNPNGTRTIDVNPYKIGAFKGEITLNPESDVWKDVDRRPDLTVTDDNSFDAIRFMAEQLGVTGTQWGEWQTNWTGTPTIVSQSTGIVGNQGIETTVTTQTGVQSREGIQTTLTSSVNSVDYGDRVVDISYQPFMRARPILFVSKNLKLSTKFYAFFDGRAVSEYIKPADVFRVTLASGATKMQFDPAELGDKIITDVPERTVDGRVEAAYSIGDVVRNQTHTATTITSISNITSVVGATSFSVTVSSSTGIAPGHHVQFYNLAPSREVNIINTNFRNLFRTTSSINDYTKNTSRELNYQTFRVLSVTGTTLVLGNIDGSTIPPFSAYDSTAYLTGDGGKVQRLTASAVVGFAGVINNYVGGSDANSPSDMEIHLVNIKNGFAAGDLLTGLANIDISVTNRVNVENINGSGLGVLPTMKKVGDPIKTDIWGSAVGVFDLPPGVFKSGERTFKLIDNISNNDKDFDSKGSAQYISSGTTLQKERTVVNSREVRFVQDRLFEDLPVRRSSTSTRVLFTIWRGHDPLAQTFTVSSTGGAFVTSVDLFFEEAGNRPVTVELRTTNFGVPSSKILPLSEVTLSPQQIRTSTNGSVATRFTFPAPLYLQDAETYALVVKTDEPGCKVFISELGQSDILTNNIVTSQPLTGSLYMSQNTEEFQINPLLDLKFNLNKALFDISSTITTQFKAVPPRSYELGKDPLEITPNSNKIRVTAKNHGFNSGDTVILSGIKGGFYGANSTTLGFPADLLNGPHTVLSSGLVDDSFLIEIETVDDDSVSLIGGALSDLVKGNYGGSGVISTRQLTADQLYLKTADISFQETNLNYSVSAEDAAGDMTPYNSVVPNSNYIFTTRRTIKSLENQLVTNPVNNVVRPSLRIRARLSSNNSNISPIIDLQKISAYSVKNLINDTQSSLVNVPEIDSRLLLTKTDGPADIVFANVTSTTATITSSDDLADNILENVSPGTNLLIGGTITGVNGTFTILSVARTSSVVGGNNADGDTVTITVSGQFASPQTVSLPLVSGEFNISVLERFVEDFAPVGATNLANYITRPLVLATPADSFKILFDANMPEGTTVTVYYRTWDNAVDLNRLNYVNTGFSKVTSDALNLFSERSIDIQDITPFKNISIKIVMKSNHPVYVPKIKNLRLVAYS
jgi:hypothetical protein